MEQMADALKVVAGERMKSILAKLTTNRFMGVVTGAFVTAVIQSSSVTTVLVVGFITAGLMSFSQSIGVIMGSNIGTTITAQIIAFKVTKLALVLIALGFGVMFTAKKDKNKHRGALVMGLGLIFFGMTIMGDAMYPLRSYQPFRDWMVRLENPFLGILAGALFTALVQSSSATTGIVIVMATQGFMTLPAGIALIFGSNIGTCVTAMLATIGRPREALRAAVIHVLFNVAGVLLWVAFIDQLAFFVTWLSPDATELEGAARLAAETPRQIANAHTVFNIANTLIFVGFSTQFARLVERLVPDRPFEEEDAIRAKYLDLELLITPSLAIDRARLEILHLGDRVKDMLQAILPAVTRGSQEELLRIAALDDAVDELHGHIITYLGHISKENLADDQGTELMSLMEATNDLENIGDIIETNLLALGLSRIEDGVTVSPETSKLLEDFHGTVMRALDASLLAVTQKNVEAAQVVIDMKREISRMSGSAARHEARRLIAEEPNRLPAYTLETDILENLKRIYYFTKRMAKTTVPEKAELVA
jgi:phosphate:Na+ symporter